MTSLRQPSSTNLTAAANKRMPGQHTAPCAGKCLVARAVLYFALSFTHFSALSAHHLAPRPKTVRARASRNSDEPERPHENPRLPCSFRTSLQLHRACILSTCPASVRPTLVRDRHPSTPDVNVVLEHAVASQHHARLYSNSNLKGCVRVPIVCYSALSSLGVKGFRVKA